MQNDFFSATSFAFHSLVLASSFAFIPTWQSPSILSFGLFFIIAIAVTLLVTTFIGSIAIQESMEPVDENLQRDAELRIVSANCCKILPLWNSHVETVKTHAEQSVQQLIMSFFQWCMNLIRLVSWGQQYRTKYLEKLRRHHHASAIV